LKKLWDVIDAINEWTGRTCSWTIVVLAILVVLEVILRRFLNSPTIWNFEVTKQLYGFHFMIIAGYALLHKSHVSIDILYGKCSERKKAILDIISYTIFFFPFLLIVLYQGIKYAGNSWAMLETSWSVFAPPLYLIKTVIPVMAFLLLLQGVAIFVRQIQTAIKGKR